MRMISSFCARRLPYWVIISIVLSIVFGIPTFAKNSTSASSEDTNRPKVINVVYDDSGSMISGDRWYKAAYALEVFTAMMGEKDILNVYPMAKYDESNDHRNRDYSKDYISVKGSDANRVDAIGNIKPCFTGGATPIECVEAAEKGLRSSNYAGYEQWLVVLTDGDQFYRGKDEISDTVAELSELLNKSARQNNVYYLAIGDAATTSSGELEKKRTADSLLIRHSDDDKILQKVTEAANTIFGYQQLPQTPEVISVSDGAYELSIDVPVTQLIIFAQGEDVDVGSLTVNGDDVKGEKPLEVECTGVPIDSKTGEQSDKYIIDGSKRLTGIVATFNSGDSPIPSGKFNVKIAGAENENVVFYYKVGAVPVCKFIDGDGNEVSDTGEGIDPGDYSIVFGFVDPLTGESIQSDLLKTNGDPIISIINNGNQLDATSGKVTIEEGDVEYSIEATFEDGQKIQYKDKINVKPELLRLSIRIDSPSEAYKAQELGDNAMPIKVTIIDDKTGAAVTKEQFDALKLKISFAKNEKNLVWGEAVKQPEAGCYEIRPYAKNNNSIKNITTGTYFFDVGIDGKINKQIINVQNTGSIQIAEYRGTRLDVVVEDVDTSVFALHYQDFAGIPVKVYMVDDATGESTPLTEEEWNCLNPKFSKAGAGIWWKCEKGKEIGSYIVRPTPPFNLLLLMRGAINIRAMFPLKQSEEDLRGYAKTVEAEIEFSGKSGQLSFAGGEQISASIIPLSGWDILSEFWKYLLAIAIVVFLGVGYIKKKRIDKSMLKPHVVFMGTRVACRKRIIGRYVPYVPERAWIYCYMPNMRCDVPNILIEADSPSTFKILNVDTLLRHAIMINASPLGPNDIKRVKEKVFTYGRFKMQPIPQGLGQRVGKFYLNN